MGSSLPVTITDKQTLSGGQFAVWADSGTGWYATRTLLASGRRQLRHQPHPQRAPRLHLQGARRLPPTSGSGPWTVYGLSAGTFTVKAP